MKLKKIFFIFLFLFLSIILFSPKSYAGSLNLDSLQYDVNLNLDGSADVKETWVIDIRNTNTLFKTFEIDKNKYSEITNVKVVETTNGQNQNFSKRNTWQYHVDEGYYYGLINSKKQFEIAWGVNENHATRVFEISYTIIDAVKNYNDCSEFYWQFISTESEIPANKISGTINLPYSNVNIDDIRVWAHGPLNGIISKNSNNKISFEVENLSSNTMLETRVVTPTDVFHLNNNISETNKLDSILSQEQTWANEANRKRESIKNARYLIIAFFIALNVIGIIITIFLIKKIFVYKKILSNAPLIKPSSPSKYFRDIPNENSTPAQAGFLYYFKNLGIENNISKIISATLLDLCMKKCISFEVSSEKKENVTVILNNNNNINLPSDEKIVYDLLQKVPSTNTQNEDICSFTMKDFKKYCERHSSEFLSVCNKITTEVKNIEQLAGNYDKNLIANYSNWTGKGILFIFFAVFGFIPFFTCIIPSVILAYYAFHIASRFNTLTQKGVDEKECWNGLKNYMEDFSLLKEKEVPDLVLWEKYLVYATAFGIADKVIKQLKVVYPQITDYNYMSTHGYTYLYWAYYGNMNGAFITSINTSVSSVYNSTHYSSGSGAGGGFSGGGGFGGGGGRNGRKIKIHTRDGPFRSILDRWGRTFSRGIYIKIHFISVGYTTE